MTDFLGATEKMLFDRLTDQVTLAQVFQHVPDTTPPPVVIIGDVDWEDEGDKDTPLWRISVQITSVIAGPGRKPLNTLQAQNHAALDRYQPADMLGVSFGEIRLSAGSGQEIQAQQGPVYFGQQTATLYAQPA